MKIKKQLLSICEQKLFLYISERTKRPDAIIEYSVFPCDFIQAAVLP